MGRQRQQTAPQIAAAFVRGHLGRGCFAPLTGTDTRAWYAFCYLLELYGASRSTPSFEALKACYRCTLRGGTHEQLNVAEVFRQTIPALLDWSDVGRLWPHIAPGSTLIPAALYRADRSDGTCAPAVFRER